MILIFGLCMGFATGIKCTKVSSGILLSILPLLMWGISGIAAYYLSFLFGTLLAESASA